MDNASSTPSFTTSGLKAACATCNLRELCMPVGLASEDLTQLESLISARRRLAKGEALFRSGNRFTSLYALRFGFVKSQINSPDGREQVTGFHMAGEIVGLDGISADVHTCDVIALEDTEVCVIAYERVEEVAHLVPMLRQHFHKVMSREIVRDQGVMLLLGSMHAEERLAAFLLNLSQRFEARGYSRTEFVLRMTRAEIGSYLGLKLETISRALSRFAADGLMEVNQKHIRIMDPTGLRAIVDGKPDCRS